jgi:hypothetical protein
VSGPEEDRAGPGEAGESERPAAVPWEDPEQPRVAALLGSLRELLRRPRAFFQALSREGWVEPLAFGLVTGTVGLLACLFWNLLASLWARGLVGVAVGLPPALTPGSGVTLVLMVLAPVIILANVLYSSLGLWAGLALVGVRPGFLTAWQIIGYAQGGMVLGLLPILGGPLGGLWVLILTLKGVQAVLGLSAGRALGALALSLFLQTLVLVVLTGMLLAMASLVSLWLFFG